MKRRSRSGDRVPKTHRTGVEFKKPPIVETAMGVEFAPLAGWGLAHFGLFWSEIRKEYPKYEVQPPLGSNIERFGSDSKQGLQFIFQVGEPTRARCWFFHQDNAHLLQVQDSRFILNWRKTSSAVEYPKYERLRPMFEHEWKQFNSFLDNNGVGPVSPVQCELTYVDHIPQGEGWRTFADLPELIPAWAGLKGPWSSPEAVTLGARFLLPEQQGRLHVNAQPAIRNQDGKDVLQLTFTVRGAPSSGDLVGLGAWFELAHKFALNAFLDFTSKKAQDEWEMTK